MRIFLSLLFLSFVIPSVTNAAILSSMELKQKYIQALLGGPKVKVLIVPGHDDQNWGTEFKGTKEVELNRVVADKLYNLFSQDKAFQVYITQQNGMYAGDFPKYYELHWDEINTFRNESIALAKKTLANSPIQNKLTVSHNVAKEVVSTILYGVNKWSNENNIDLVIHVHFNDYGGRTWNKEGIYNGFTIYVPDSQLKNSAISKPIAESVFYSLAQFSPISNLPGEAGGVTEDKELIAIGSQNTLDAASMLIEYGYIYEPQLTATVTRKVVLDDYAYRTYLGVKKFFGGSSTRKIDSLIFPKVFSKELKKDTKPSVDVLALQMALVKQGLYPADGLTLNVCPISGVFGSCTENAVKEFQQKNKLPSTGLVGALTRAKLNLFYSK